MGCYVFHDKTVKSKTDLEKTKAKTVLSKFLNVSHDKMAHCIFPQVITFFRVKTAQAVA